MISSSRARSADHDHRVAKPACRGVLADTMIMAETTESQCRHLIT
jgi:hypothetical protein